MPLSGALYEVDAALDACSDTLTALLTAQLARTPDLPAVSDAEVTLFYADLDRRSAALATRLRDLGVGPDVLVGLHLERSVALSVAVVAILRAGGAWLPLNTTDPVSRLHGILDDARPRVVLCDDPAVLDAAPGAPVLVALTRAGEVVSGPSDGAGPIDAAQPDDLAYVIYTSGSTGRSKGVMIEHRAIVNRLRWMQERFPLGPGDVVAQKTPVTFDVSVWELIWPLLVGARLAFAEPGGHRDAAYLTRFFEAEEVTVTHFVPSMLREFLRAVPPGRCRTLRRVMASGEALPPELVTSFYERLPGTELHNLYGPTEAAVDVTHWACPPDHPPGEPVPIGAPITGIELLAIDEQGRSVADGEVGELCILGVGVARGYLNRPDLDDRFLPVAGHPDRRAYRTGDLASLAASGVWLYHGRNDRQVKVGGVRLELGEVEAALTALPYVRAGHVMVEECDGLTRLVAAVVLGGGDSTRWRDDLAARLPAIAVPASMTAVDDIPLTAHGKVDTARLAEAVRAAAPVADEADDVVGSLWSRLLGTSEPDFLVAGGSSLTAVRLLGDLAQVCGVEIGIADFMASPKLPALRALVAGAATAGVPPRPVERTAGPLPLNRLQERLWFLQELEPTSTAMSAPTALRIRGAGRFAVTAAVLGVLGRHEVFRSRVAAEGGVPHVRWDAPLAELPWSEQHGHGDGEREEMLRRAVESDAAEPFDLSAGPPVRVRGIAFAADDHAVVLVTHQIVADGWTWSLLCQQVLDALTGAGAAGRAPDALQVVDHAVWQRELEGTDDHRAMTEAAAAHWLQALADAPDSLSLPTDGPRGEGLSVASDWVQVPWCPTIGADVARVAAQRQVTGFGLLLAAYGAWLGRLAGQETVVLGTPMAHRFPGWTDAMAGYFVTTVPQRLDIDEDATFADLLAATRTTVTANLRHTILPIEGIVAEVAGRRRGDRLPLFQNLFVYQNMPAWKAVRDGTSVVVHQYPPRHTHYDLKFEVFPLADGFPARLVFASQRFTRQRAEAMAAQLARFVEACLDVPDAYLGDIAM